MPKVPEQEPTLERYELVERIAGGGMGEVFRAVAYGAHGFEKDLAVKRILPRFAQNREFERNFVEEAKLAATLNHGNIVGVLDFGRLGGALYLAMEYVDGLDLAALLSSVRESEQRLPIGVALYIAIELCKGLEFAHRKGVVHRDISPANVLLSRAGEVKIADFGIARAVRRSTSSMGTGRIVGKLRYMSPEQSRGIPLDARSDVFSTAVVLFEAASGDRLFSGNDFDTSVDEIRNKPIPKLSELVDDPPPGLDEVMAAALERDREQRVQTAGELLRKLTRLCYAVEPPPTSLDIATSVEDVLEGRDADAEARALDDRILAELAGVGVSADEPSRITRVKPATRDTSPQTPKGKGAGAARGQTLTFFRVAARAGELSSLEFGDESTVRERPTAPTQPTAPAPPTDPTLTAGESEQAPRPAVTRRGGLVVGAVLAVAAAGGAIWFGLIGDGERVVIEDAVQVGSDAPDAPDADAEPPPPLDAGSRTQLAVTTRPHGAMVALDSRQLGPTPLDMELDSDAAEHVVSISLTGYKTHEAKVRFGGEPVAIDLALARLEVAPKKGTISLFSHPWANVYFRGRKVARAPVQKLKLPVGKHRLRLVNPVLGLEKSIRVTVPRKRPYRVELKRD